MSNPLIKLSVAALLVGQAAVLWWFGQPALCACGFKLWEGVVYSAGNSQQLTDWYTFSHIIHGFIFYFIAWLFFPRWSIWQRLLLTIGLEVGWEIIENTPWAIGHYRDQILARDYNGDSIINSLSDTVAMIAGFALARRLSVRAIVALALAFELFTGYFIHDNLSLNILNFLYPFEAVTEWQSQIN